MCMNILKCHVGRILTLPCFSASVWLCSFTSCGLSLMLLMRTEINLQASINRNVETSQVWEQQSTENVCPVPHLLPTKHQKSRAETEGLRWKYIHCLISAFCCDAFSLLFLHNNRIVGIALCYYKVLNLHPLDTEESDVIHRFLMSTLTESRTASVRTVCLYWQHHMLRTERERKSLRFACASWMRHILSPVLMRNSIKHKIKRKALLDFAYSHTPFLPWWIDISHIKQAWLKNCLSLTHKEHWVSTSLPEPLRQQVCTSISLFTEVKEKSQKNFSRAKVVHE